MCIVSSGGTRPPSTKIWRPASVAVCPLRPRGTCPATCHWSRPRVCLNIQCKKVIVVPLSIVFLLFLLLFFLFFYSASLHRNLQIYTACSRLGCCCDTRVGVLLPRPRPETTSVLSGHSMVPVQISLLHHFDKTGSIPKLPW